MPNKNNKKGKKVKNKINHEVTNNTLPPVTEEEKKELQELLTILNKNVPEILKNDKKVSRDITYDDLHNLIRIINEYLTPFIVVGYKLGTNERVYLGNAKNQLEQDALVEHLKNVFLKMVNPQED